MGKNGGQARRQQRRRRQQKIKKLDVSKKTLGRGQALNILYLGSVVREHLLTVWGKYHCTFGLLLDC